MASDKPFLKVPFEVMASLEPYSVEPNMLHSLNTIAVKIVKGMIAWKKIHFADLVKRTKSVAGFSPSHQF